MAGRSKARLIRLVVVLVIGVATALLTVPQPMGAVIGWTVAAACYCIWTWWLIWPMSPTQTQQHAKELDPSRGVTDAVLLLAAFGSVGGVAMLLLGGQQVGLSRVLEALVGVLAVTAAWFVVPTLFAVRYADLYYSQGGKTVIDFGDQTEPSYADFGYLAFTLAMTYQVSDTALRSSSARRLGLRQALICYPFGVVILGCVVNLVAALVSSN